MTTVNTSTDRRLHGPTGKVVLSTAAFTARWNLTSDSVVVVVASRGLGSSRALTGWASGGHEPGSVCVDFRAGGGSPSLALC